MAIDKRLFIYATFIISCAAVGLTVTAFATESWISGEMKPLINTTSDNDFINYGLFSGTLMRRILATAQNYDLYVTCLTAENVCAWSCTNEADERMEELKALYFNGTFAFKCTSIASTGVTRRTYSRGAQSYSYNKLINRIERVKDDRYLNAALRMSTIVFLALGLVFAVTGAVFAVVNSAMTPIELITGIFGLYIWNVVALVCDAIVLIMWGSHFAVTLTNNVAFTEVIFGSSSSEGLAQLGYSYWMVLGAALCHIANLSLLGVRQVLINKEPVQKTVEMEANDGDIFLY